MSTAIHITELVTQFEKVNGELAAAVEGCSDAEWSRITAAEGWTVAATVHHVVTVQRGFARIVATLAAGGTVTPTLTIAELNEANARHAEEFADADRQESLAILTASRDDILALLRKLDDADLERAGGVFGGNEMTVGQVIENIIIGHARGHLASIRATLDS